jgi:gliding motility-associatede transport system auxiliary component
MKRDWTSRSAIVIIGLILVALNLVGLNLFGRVDLTDDNVYSLSDASIEIIHNLEDPLTITAYFSEGLPAPYSSNRRFLKDKLDDYRAYGGSNFQYRFVDPKDDPELQQSAQQDQIPPVQIRVVESDNVQIKNAFMGLSIRYGGEKESIPVIQDLSTLEYDITSAIRRLTREDTPTVGFLGGHGEPDLQKAFVNLQQLLSRNYTVEPITIENGAIDNPPAALLVVAPKDTLPDEDLRAIDDYIMNGGRVGFLLNRVTADLQQGQASLLSTGLETMLSGYGMGLSDDLVMDMKSSVVTVQRRQGFFNMQQQIPYPFFPIANTFNQDNMMVNRLRDLVFYFVSSVDTSLVLPTGVERESLIFSSPQSSTQKGFFFIQPVFERANYQDGPFILAASYAGTFPSAFNEGQTSPGTRLVLVGDGDLLNESIIGRVPGNAEFGLNLVDWLVQDEALLSIRSKKIEARALSPVSEKLRPLIKYGNMLGPVLLVILFGFLRWRRRKNRRVVLTG